MTPRTKKTTAAISGALVLASGAYALGSQAGGGAALAGTTTAPSSQQQAGRPWGPGPGGPRRDFSALAARLGVSPAKLRAALQDLRPDRRADNEATVAKALAGALGLSLRRHGHELPERVEIGTMVEVPSLLFQLNELLERVDFLSVGSNDLMQFLYAADRGNPRVSERFDPLSAPVLRALKDIADKAKKHGKPVTLCGELASQPIGALALTILGYRTLSLSPSAVGPVKALLLDLDCRKGEEFLLPCLEQPVGSVSIRHKLETFAANEGLQL